jgi:hypothetical protein
MTTATLVADAPASVIDRPRADLARRASTIRLTLQAFREGLGAARRYERLVAKGLPPAEAAARAFGEAS